MRWAMPLLMPRHLSVMRSSVRFRLTTSYRHDQKPDANAFRLMVVHLSSGSPDPALTSAVVTAQASETRQTQNDTAKKPFARQRRANGFQSGNDAIVTSLCRKGLAVFDECLEIVVRGSRVLTLFELRAIDYEESAMFWFGFPVVGATNSNRTIICRVGPG